MIESKKGMLMKMLQIIIKLIGILLVLLGIILVYDARILTKRFFRIWRSK